MGATGQRTSRGCSRWWWRDHERLTDTTVHAGQRPATREGSGPLSAGDAWDRLRQEKAGETCAAVGSRGTGWRESTLPRPSSPVTAHVSVAKGDDAPRPGSAHPKGSISVIVAAGGNKVDDGPGRVTICPKTGDTPGDDRSSQPVCAPSIRPAEMAMSRENGRGVMRREASDGNHSPRVAGTSPTVARSRTRRPGRPQARVRSRASSRAT